MLNLDELRWEKEEAMNHCMGEEREIDPAELGENILWLSLGPIVSLEEVPLPTEHREKLREYVYALDLLGISDAEPQYDDRGLLNCLIDHAELFGAAGLMAYCEKLGEFWAWYRKAVDPGVLEMCGFGVESLLCFIGSFSDQHLVFVRFSAEGRPRYTICPGDLSFSERADKQ